MTMKVDKRINECARMLNDGRLRGKLSAGDAVAQELKYHPACFTALNRERDQDTKHESPCTKDAYFQLLSLNLSHTLIRRKLLVLTINRLYLNLLI